MASGPAAAHRPVVTISAPYGTGGSLIGPRLAEALQVPFVDRAIPVSVSRRLDIPVEEAIDQEEATQDRLTRWAAYFAPAVQLFGGMAIGEAALQPDQAFREATEEALREHAGAGAVILGRAGAIVLRDVPGAVHVRLTGSPERRLAQGMQMTGADRDTAAREMRASDLARETYVKDWYRADPADPSLYHLVIDSTQLPVDCCLELVLTAVRSAGRPTTGPSAPPHPAGADPASESA
ncbi:MAG TPA: cytidylate kinase-like family protein [Solirubrobacteraceae bacterium]|jgi:cytidylate kinase|nr:cytidylate kinase-like family protein [Solirubrobacteraceae bacterium]